MSDKPNLSSLLGFEAGSQPHSAPADYLAGAGTVMVQRSVADDFIQRMVEDDITELQVNGWGNVVFTRDGTRHVLNGTAWASYEDYVLWLDRFVRTHTDSTEPVLLDPNDPASYNPKVDRIEASLIGNLYGSIHLQMPYTTASRMPILVVRRQPRTAITLEEMVEQGVMNAEMGVLLEAAVRGRANILVAGGSGAGKTTLLRALAEKVDPSHRVVTVEDANELNLQGQNVVALVCTKHYGENGEILRQVTTDDLVRDALRMRPDRIWVGEVRGREAAALVKACLTGHDGSLTTIHSHDALDAVNIAAEYITEAGVGRRNAVDQVVRAFDLVVHIKSNSRGVRQITSIAEVDPVVEPGEQPMIRISNIWTLNWETGIHERGFPPNRLQRKASMYGVNIPWNQPTSYR